MDRKEKQEEVLVDVSELKDIIKLFEASTLSRMEIKNGNVDLKLEKEGPAAQPVSGAAPAWPEGQPGSQKTEVFDSELAVIKSPLVGIFHLTSGLARKKPLACGDHVEAGEAVCVVEAMKTMNQILCEQAGIVQEILVGEGEAVEFDQPLLVIKKDTTS